MLHKYPRVAKGTTTGQDAKLFGSSLDYLLIYSKKSNLEIGGLQLTEEDKKRFSYKDDRGLYSILQFRKTGTNDRREDRPNLYYPLNNPDGNKVFPVGPTGYESCWRTSKKTFEEWEKDQIIQWIKRDNKYVPYVKYYLEGRTKQPSNLWDDIDGNKKATIELKELIGKGIFTNPKPTALIKRMFKIAQVDNSDVVLDFFAGSATTAHAVIDANRKNRGFRKFIMVQLPECCDETSEAFKAKYRTIADIGKERIRRVIKKIEVEQKEDKKKSEGMLFEESRQAKDKPLDLGFKVFKLDSSNIKTWDSDFDSLEKDLLDSVDNVKKDRSAEDVLYEILLKYGLDLTLPIEERKICKKTVYSIGLGALIVCLDKDISLDVVEGIAKLKEELNPEVSRVVFSDAGFKDDVIKTNTVQILKQHGIEDVKSI